MLEYRERVSLEEALYAWRTRCEVLYGDRFELVTWAVLFLRQLNSHFYLINGRDHAN